VKGASTPPGVDPKRLVGKRGKKISRVGFILLGLVGVGGLGVDAIVLLSTGSGDWARIRVSLAICAVAAYVIGFGYILDEADRERIATKNAKEGFG